MEITTTRFGPIRATRHELIEFPGGLPGLEDCCQWLLLDDNDSDMLAWLQCATDPDVALAVVNPADFVPCYRLCVPRKDLEPLGLKHAEEAQVLVVLGKHDGALTLNLKAPLVINPQQRVGRQLISTGELPVRYPLVDVDAPLRKTA